MHVLYSGNWPTTLLGRRGRETYGECSLAIIYLTVINHLKLLALTVWGEKDASITRI
jgi:hypothetical protein